MRLSFSVLSTVLLLGGGGAIAGCNGKPTTCLDASVVASSGKPVGKEVVYKNSEFGTGITGAEH